MPALASILRVASVFLVAIAIVTPSALAHDEGDDHDHAHHHGPVVQPKDFDHATDLIHEGLIDIEAAIARGDMSALHTLSDGVAVPARQLGKLAARRSGVVPANIRAINNVGRDLADLVDAMHVAADAGKSDVVMAKWKELEAVRAQFSGIAPRASLYATIDTSVIRGNLGTEGAAIDVSYASNYRVEIRDSGGKVVTPSTPYSLVVVSPDLRHFYTATWGKPSSTVVKYEQAWSDVVVSVDNLPAKGQYTVFATDLPPEIGRTTLRAIATCEQATPNRASPSPEPAAGDVVVASTRTFRLIRPDHIHAGEPASLSILISPRETGAASVVSSARVFLFDGSARTMVTSPLESRNAPLHFDASLTLPQPGRYTAWFAFLIDNAQVNVPFILESHDEHAGEEPEDQDHR